MALSGNLDKHQRLILERRNLQTSDFIEEIIPRGVDCSEKVRGGGNSYNPSLQNYYYSTTNTVPQASVSWWVDDTKESTDPVMECDSPSDFSTDSFEGERSRYSHMNTENDSVMIELSPGRDVLSGPSIDVNSHYSQDSKNLITLMRSQLHDMEVALRTYDRLSYDEADVVSFRGDFIEVKGDSSLLLSVDHVDSSSMASQSVSPPYTDIIPTHMDIIPISRGAAAAVEQEDDKSNTRHPLVVQPDMKVAGISILDQSPTTPRHATNGPSSTLSLHSSPSDNGSCRSCSRSSISSLDVDKIGVESDISDYDIDRVGHDLGGHSVGGADEGTTGHGLGNASTEKDHGHVYGAPLRVLPHWEGEGEGEGLSYVMTRISGDALPSGRPCTGRSERHENEDTCLVLHNEVKNEVHAEVYEVRTEARQCVSDSSAAIGSDSKEIHFHIYSTSESSDSFTSEQPLASLSEWTDTAADRVDDMGGDSRYNLEGEGVVLAEGGRVLTSTGGGREEGRGPGRIVDGYDHDAIGLYRDAPEDVGADSSLSTETNRLQVDRGVVAPTTQDPWQQHQYLTQAIQNIPGATSSSIHRAHPQAQPLAPLDTLSPSPSSSSPPPGTDENTFALITDIWQDKPRQLSPSGEISHSAGVGGDPVNESDRISIPGRSLMDSLLGFQDDEQSSSGTDDGDSDLAELDTFPSGYNGDDGGSVGVRREWTEGGHVSQVGEDFLYDGSNISRALRSSSASPHRVDAANVEGSEEEVDERIRPRDDSLIAGERTPSQLLNEPSRPAMRSAEDTSNACSHDDNNRDNSQSAVEADLDGLPDYEVPSPCDPSGIYGDDISRQQDLPTKSTSAPESYDEEDILSLVELIDEVLSGSRDGSNASLTSLPSSTRAQQSTAYTHRRASSPPQSQERGLRIVECDDVEQVAYLSDLSVMDEDGGGAGVVSSEVLEEEVEVGMGAQRDASHILTEVPREPSAPTILHTEWMPSTGGQDVTHSDREDSRTSEREKVDTLRSGPRSILSYGEFPATVPALRSYGEIDTAVSTVGDGQGGIAIVGQRSSYEVRIGGIYTDDEWSVSNCHDDQLEGYMGAWADRAQHMPAQNESPTMERHEVGEEVRRPVPHESPTMERHEVGEEARMPVPHESPTIERHDTFPQNDASLDSFIRNMPVHTVHTGDDVAEEAVGVDDKRAAGMGGTSPHAGSASAGWLTEAPVESNVSPIPLLHSDREERNDTVLSSSEQGDGSVKSVISDSLNVDHVHESSSSQPLIPAEATLPTSNIITTRTSEQVVSAPVRSAHHRDMPLTGIKDLCAPSTAEALIGNDDSPLFAPPRLNQRVQGTPGTAVVNVTHHKGSQLSPSLSSYDSSASDDEMAYDQDSVDIGADQHHLVTTATSTSGLFFHNEPSASLPTWQVQSIERAPNESLLSSVSKAVQTRPLESQGRKRTVMVSTSSDTENYDGRPTSSADRVAWKAVPLERTHSSTQSRSATWQTPGDSFSHHRGEKSTPLRAVEEVSRHRHLVTWSFGGSAVGAGSSGSRGVASTGGGRIRNDQWDKMVPDENRKTSAVNTTLSSRPSHLIVANTVGAPLTAVVTQPGTSHGQAIPSSIRTDMSASPLPDGEWNVRDVIQGASPSPPLPDEGQAATQNMHQTNSLLTRRGSVFAKATTSQTSSSQRVPPFNPHDSGGYNTVPSAPSSTSWEVINSFSRSHESSSRSTQERDTTRNITIRPLAWYSPLAGPPQSAQTAEINTSRGSTDQGPYQGNTGNAPNLLSPIHRASVRRVTNAAYSGNSHGASSGSKTRSPSASVLDGSVALSQLWVVDSILRESVWEQSPDNQPAATTPSKHMHTHYHSHISDPKTVTSSSDQRDSVDANIKDLEQTLGLFLGGVNAIIRESKHSTYHI